MRPHLSRCFTVLAAALLLLAPRVEAQTYNLDFSAFVGDGGAIPASYGDVAGVVDVSMGHRVGWGNTLLNDTQGYHWTYGYNDLVDVAYTISGGGVGEISFANLASGSAVTLNSTDVGAWLSRTDIVGLRVYDSNWNLLFNSSGATVGSTTHASFSPASSDISGLYVQWSAIDGLGNPTDAYNVGIDNVNFTVSAIATPEPASLTLFATGFIALAGVAGRRRSR